MSPLGWAAVAVSAVGCVWGWRFTFRAEISEYDNIGWEMVTATGLFSLTVCPFWPVMLGFVIASRVVEGRDPAKFARRIAGESRADKLARRERELRDRERHVAQLERELGVKDSG